METVTIWFTDQEIELDEIDDSMTWEELFDLLYDSGKITDDEYQLGLNSEKFYDLVEENLDLRSQSIERDNSPVRKNQKRGLSFGSVKKSDSTLSTSTSEEGSASTISFGKSKPIQEPGKSLSFGQKKPIVRDKPVRPKPEPEKQLNVRTDGNIYNLDVTCSGNSKKWVSIIQSDLPPTTFEFKPQKNVSTGTIHLVLDDSGSMGWEKPTRLSQLILAVNRFLDERPANERIYLHTFNNSLSGKGKPEKIRRIVNGKWDLHGTPMRSCLNRVANSVKSDDILLLFTDGASTDGNPEPASRAIKSKGVRFICVGCGDAKEGLMKSMATSHADYHHATNAKDLVQIFENISKSLSQSRPKTSGMGKKNSSSVAKQIANNAWSASSSSQVGSNKLSANQGYAFIENFACYHCKNTSRVVCGGCGENLCGGGIKNNEIKCPVCSIVCEVEVSTEAFGKVGAGGKSKGK